MKIVAIIQARMSSTRLPGKVLAPTSSKPVLQHVIDRLCPSRFLDGIVVATTLSQPDDVICSVCRDWGVPNVRGSELDVIDRYYQTAKIHKVELVVRITSDCPLVDPVLVDSTIQHYLEHTFDYVTCGDVINHPCSEFDPDGSNVEVFSFETLERAWKESKSREDFRYLATLKCGFSPYQTIPPLFKLSVDTLDDLKLVSLVFGALGDQCSFKEANDFLRRRAVNGL